MITRIRKWGNSLALRIPRSFAEEARVEAGSTVDISLDGDRLVIRPVRSTFALEDLLSKVTRDNLHEEVETGDPVGREAW